ncbi:MAG: zinc/iron-chelating domain-containing protein [Nitrospira sp.]|nr:MAG: zinc/iron-chelating domain-containing protein [Nitrospira sp.]
MTTQATERFEIALNTPAGQLTTAVEVPTGFVAVTAIVPLMRRLGEEAQALEEARSTATGKTVSCHKGCAACCRMMVPLSAPEALALREFVQSLATERQQRIAERLARTKSLLLSHGLWNRLLELGETTQPPDDEVLEPINRDYYALRIPCPFLEDEVCSIYEERPAACRELLVTSPAEWCQDLVKNPVEQIPVPVRIGPALGLLWGELTQSPARLIPLPIALEWAQRHQRENHATWQGTQLLDQALDKVWRFLSQAFQKRSEEADS